VGSTSQRKTKIVPLDERIFFPRMQIREAMARNTRAGTVQAYSSKY